MHKWVGVIGLGSCVRRNRGLLESIVIGDTGTSGSFIFICIVSCGAFIVKCEGCVVGGEGGGEVNVMCG